MAKAGPTTTAPLRLRARCTTEPLPDGKFACAMSGTAGVAFEPRRQEIESLLDSIRLVGAGEASLTPAEPPTSPDNSIITNAPDEFTIAIAPNEAWARIEIDELSGLWTGVWTRRPGTNIYDAIWRSAKYPEVRDVVRLEQISGASVVFTRDGNGGRYTGTISPDGAAISGTASWYSKGMTWSGRVALAGDAPSGGRPPPPIRRVKQLIDSFNGQACELTNAARFTLQSATQITNIEVWYNWRVGETVTPFELVGETQVIARGQLARGACDAAQGQWCTASASVAIEAPAGSYAVRTMRGGRLCQNADSGHNESFDCGACNKRRDFDHCRRSISPTVRW